MPYRRRYDDWLKPLKVPDKYWYLGKRSYAVQSQALLDLLHANNVRTHLNVQGTFYVGEQQWQHIDIEIEENNHITVLPQGGLVVLHGSVLEIYNDAHIQACHVCPAHRGYCERCKTLLARLES